MENVVDLSSAFFALLKTEEERKQFQKLNSTSIRLLNKLLHSGVFNQGQKFKCEASIAKLKGLGYKAKRTHHSGAGLAAKNRSQRVQWVDIKSAFKSRIRSACVINLTHKFPEAFIDDAFRLLQSRLKNTLKTDVVIKVNVGLICVFTLDRTGEIEDKHFTTRNFQITRTTPIPDVLKK